MTFKLNVWYSNESKGGKHFIATNGSVITLDENDEWCIVAPSFEHNPAKTLINSGDNLTEISGLNIEEKMGLMRAQIAGLVEFGQLERQAVVDAVDQED